VVTPVPAPGSEVLTSHRAAQAVSPGLSAAFGELASASKKEEIAASQKIAQRVIVQYETEIGELKLRMRELERERNEVREVFHKANTERLVISERLAGVRSQAEMSNWFDWLLTGVIALGGFIGGFGISWPDLPWLVRGILAFFGLALLALPIVSKFFHRPGANRP
jgi:hypothetical protein